MLIDYFKLLSDAGISIVKKVMLDASKDGLPGEHHFFVTFDTKHSEVEMDKDLIEAYPDEMTIVIQHQFWDFKVQDEFFSIVLKFGGRPSKLKIPFKSMKIFSDPFANFSLKFNTETSVEESNDSGSDSASKDDSLSSDKSKGDNIINFKDLK